MSVENFFESQSRALNYTKPCQLPTNIAFRLVKWEMEESRFEKKKTPKVILKADDYVDLAVWIGSRHANISDEQVASLNKSISEGKKYYIVARLFSKQEQVPVDVLSEQKKVAQSLEDFDPDVHSLRPVDKDGNLIHGPPQASQAPASYGKRMRSSE